MRSFAIRYSRWLRWPFVVLGMGPRRSGVELDGAWLTVRMGPWFRARIPRACVTDPRLEPDVWWAIGVHTDFRGTWLVNGSAKGIVSVTLEPPAEATAIGFHVRPKRLALGLEDPEGFIAALGGSYGS